MEYLTPLTPFVLLIARLMLGIVMLYYGIPKLRNIKSNVKDFVQMGFKPGWLWGGAVVGLESCGGILIVLGIFTTSIALLFSVEMLVGAIWKKFIAKKAFPDYSYDLILLSLCLLLAVLGPGALALVG